LSRQPLMPASIAPTRARCILRAAVVTLARSVGPWWSGRPWRADAASYAKRWDAVV
jgi:hypothetical protein